MLRKFTMLKGLRVFGASAALFVASPLLAQQAPADPAGGNETGGGTCWPQIVAPAAGAGAGACCASVGRAAKTAAQAAITLRHLIMRTL